jgi:hypothetical protein
MTRACLIMIMVAGSDGTSAAGAVHVYVFIRYLHEGRKSKRMMCVCMNVLRLNTVFKVNIKWSRTKLSKNIKIKIYKTVILLVVLYRCETWSLTLREEHRLRIFENRELRRIFGPKREEDRSCRKLHNDELHSLYSSPNVVRVVKLRRMRWVGHVARMGEGRGIYRILVGRPEGTRPSGRPRRR